MDCTFKRIAKEENNYTLTIKGMTQGSILALHKALTDYAEKSCVAKDVLLSFERGANQIPNSDWEIKRDINYLKGLPKI